MLGRERISASACMRLHGIKVSWLGMAEGKVEMKARSMVRVGAGLWLLLSPITTLV